MFRINFAWRRYRLLLWLGLLLVAGFFATSLASYMVSRDLVRQTLVDQSLPLTGDTIYSEIQRDVLRPTFISSLMANDTFVRDWILSGEQDVSQIARYLKEVKEKYGTISSFLVSNRTGNYYHAEGLLKKVREDETRDIWFYRVRDMEEDYEMNVDPDLANKDTITIFINYRIYDYQGNFIGATGVGLTLDTLSRIISSMQERFGRRIFFVDDKGNILVSGQGAGAHFGSLHDWPGLAQIAPQILNHQSQPTQLLYQRDGQSVVVSSRYIPELKWHLIVEQDEAPEFLPLQRVFWLNLLVSAAITLLVMWVILYTVNRFRRRLEEMAATDSLTRLLNRQAFGFVFEQAVHESGRSHKPLSALLLDIDYFKQINDTYGHGVGDQVLRRMAVLFKSVLRENDIVCRWGGEEFFILLRDCSREDALVLAQKLRRILASQPLLPTHPQLQVTFSLGLVEHRGGETLAQLFDRADKALYQAKSAGRDRIEVA
jgi:diguanylate cyclase (GGDEF)-like protein